MSISIDITGRAAAAKKQAAERQALLQGEQSSSDTFSLPFFKSANSSAFSETPFNDTPVTSGKKRIKELESPTWDGHTFTYGKCLFYSDTFKYIASYPFKKFCPDYWDDIETIIVPEGVQVFSPSLRPYYRNHIILPSTLQAIYNPYINNRFVPLYNEGEPFFVTLSGTNQTLSVRSGKLYIGTETPDSLDSHWQMALPYYINFGIIKIPEGVECLHDLCLPARWANDMYLERIILPRSLKKIENGMFVNCTIKELIVRTDLEILDNAFLNTVVQTVRVAGSLPVEHNSIPAEIKGADAVRSCIAISIIEKRYIKHDESLSEDLMKKELSYILPLLLKYPSGFKLWGRDIIKGCLEYKVLWDGNIGPIRAISEFIGANDLNFDIQNYNDKYFGDNALHSDLDSSDDIIEDNYSFKNLTPTEVDLPIGSSTEMGAELSIESDVPLDMSMMGPGKFMESAEFSYLDALPFDSVPDSLDPETQTSTSGTSSESMGSNSFEETFEIPIDTDNLLDQSEKKASATRKIPEIGELEGLGSRLLAKSVE